MSMKDFIRQNKEQVRAAFVVAFTGVAIAIIATVSASYYDGQVSRLYLGVQFIIAGYALRLAYLIVTEKL
jgi:hypothetical protein